MNGINRREVLQFGALLGASGMLPALAGETIRSREIPGTDVRMPVIGLGNSNAFRRGDADASRAVLARLQEFGGRYVDCSGPSRFVVADAVRDLGFEDAFPGAYFDLNDADTVISEARRLQKQLGREQLDLMQCYTDQVDRWSVLERAREEGLTRFIGTARHTSDYYEAMIELMQSGTVDVLQVNYSMLEPEAETRVLPVARDEGVAVMVNRPFINGRYFEVVRGHTLPEWAAEFDCESWAQFSLKYILSHPAVTCVLTETENPRHAVDNLRAGLGRLPDEATRARMRAHLVALAEAA